MLRSRKRSGRSGSAVTRTARTQRSEPDETTNRAIFSKKRTWPDTVGPLSSELLIGWFTERSLPLTNPRPGDRDSAIGRCTRCIPPE